MCFLNHWQDEASYFETLQFLAGLSKLFSDNEVPYLDYRLAENVFCSCFGAVNDARLCTAYDAHFEQKNNLIGIGIKTFILKNNKSLEKIAEFNKLKNVLDKLHGLDLARKLAEFRNDRIDFSDNLYKLDNKTYHIVGRKAGLLCIFNTPYEKIDINNIAVRKENDQTLHFDDGKHLYAFNRSKTVLQKYFEVSEDAKEVPVQILDNPLDFLRNYFLQEYTNNFENSLNIQANIMRKGIDYVILPLYSTQGKRKIASKSGLNHWNAGGRPRDENEIYIPIPISIHNRYPLFFPNLNVPFILKLPNRQELSVKVCQQNRKALMSNPNADLGKWLLRDVLKKPAGEILTIEDLDRIGIDSVIIKKLPAEQDRPPIFSISFADNYESYDEFLSEDD